MLPPAKTMYPPLRPSKLPLLPSEVTASAFAAMKSPGSVSFFLSKTMTGVPTLAAGGWARGGVMMQGLGVDVLP